MRKSPRSSRQCSVCGGPLQATAKLDICRRNLKCKRANASQHNYSAKRQRKAYTPCAKCGGDWKRASRGEKLCGACRETVFWCIVGGHMAPLAVRVSGGGCRACRLVRHARNRAKVQGVPFSLTWDYIESIWSETCPYLGVPLENSTGKGFGPGRRSPSLDRIDPAAGYVVGNVEVMSHMANTMKLDATPGQLVMFAHEVLRRYATPVQEVAR